MRSRSAMLRMIEVLTNMPSELLIQRDLLIGVNNLRWWVTAEFSRESLKLIIDSGKHPPYKISARSAQLRLPRAPKVVVGAHALLSSFLLTNNSPTVSSFIARRSPVITLPLKLTRMNSIMPLQN